MPAESYDPPRSPAVRAYVAARARLRHDVGMEPCEQCGAAADESCKDDCIGCDCQQCIDRRGVSTPGWRITLTAAEAALVLQWGWMAIADAEPYDLEHPFAQLPPGSEAVYDRLKAVAGPVAPVTE